MESPDADTNPAYGLGPTLGFDLDRATDEAGAIELLGASREWLRKQRVKGLEPRFFKVGRSVRYVVRDLIEFRNSNMWGKPKAKAATP